MKYLRTFENFEAQGEEELNPTAFDLELQEDEFEDDYPQDEDEEEDQEEAHEEITLEKKKLPAGLKAYLDKKRKGSTKSTAKGKSKPDFLDLDKDGDKKEPVKKAAKEAKKK